MMRTDYAMPLNRSPSPMLRALSQRWWLVMLRGISAIVFGILAWAWPGATLLVLIICFGAYALVDGALSLFAAYSGRSGGAPAWWLVTIGVLGVAAGLACLFWPELSAVLLIMLIGAWSLIRGVVEIVGAFQLRKELENGWLLVVSGIVSIAFGLAVLISPEAGAIAMVWLLAAYAVVFGILMVALSLWLRRRGAARPDSVP